MSKFLDSIVARLNSIACELLEYEYDNDCRTSEFSNDVVSIKRDIQQIGENARKMLEIGILQDHLLELGFEYAKEIGRMNYFVERNKPFELKYIIYFEAKRIIIASPLCPADYLGEYTPTFREDVIEKVKALIK